MFIIRGLKLLWTPASAMGLFRQAYIGQVVVQ